MILLSFPLLQRLILFSMSSPVNSLCGIDETDYHTENEIRLSQRLLYDNSSPRPSEEFVFENSNADAESFSPSPIMEEIDLTFTPDDPMPPSIEEDDDDSRDILIREELLDNYSLPLPENESFHFDIPLSSRPPAKPLHDNTGILNIKMMGDVSDQKESSNSLEDNIISELPTCVAITPDFLITDSLSMGDEHLDTIPATESDKFIKSSVENHVPIPSESEDECECDVPDCDDSQTTNFSKFSNPLFDDSTSSDDESSHEEDILEMSFKTYSNPLFDLDEEIISSEFNLIHNEDLESTPKNDRFDTEPYLLESLPNRDTLMSSPLKIDSLLAEFADALIFLKLIPPGIDEVDCYPKEDIHLVERLLYDNSSSRPPEEIVYDNSNADIESFSPSSIPNEDSDSHMEEIDLSLNPDDPMSSSIEDGDHDSKRDISILAELLENYSLLLPDNESYYFDIPSPYSPPAKPPDGKTGTLNIKMMGDVFDQKKFKEDLFTYCIENLILQDSSNPSNDNTNVVNALQEPFVVEQDPSKYSSQTPPQINHHCCYGCDTSLEDIFCHQCTCKLCENGAHYGYNFSLKVPIIPDPKPFNNQTIDELPQTVPSFDPPCYSENGNSFTYYPKSNFVHDSPNVFDPPPQPPLYSYEFCENDARYDHYCTPQVPFIYSKPCYNQTLISRKIFMIFNNNIIVVKIAGLLMKLTNIPACYDDDDDDDDYTIAITHKEPDKSLSMGDEHLDTIPATKLDECVKSSVENLVPNQSEFEGKSECDVPSCEVFTTLSNILFDAAYDFHSSDNQSFSYEDNPKKIYPNPLFDEEIIFMKIDSHHFNVESNLIESFLNHDSSIISSSSKIDSLFNEFTGELTLFKSIPSGINETDCDPEEETSFIKRLFDSLIEEIDLSFTLDYPMPLGIEEDDYDSEGDILFLEEFLSNNSLSLPENESFHFDIPSSSRPPAKPPDGNTGILNVKMMGDIFKHKVPMPRLMSTQPTLVPNQEKSLELLPHQGHEAFQPSAECPMMIYGKNTPILDVLFFHFYPP
nr:hypothetical protein [Tanacetum cinerariifolium]